MDTARPVSAITYRKICWPTPDAVCMQGGCGYCNDNPMRSIITVRAYARTHDMMKDFRYGEDTRWPNVHTTTESRA